jgi:hypothetical protein
MEKQSFENSSEKSELKVDERENGDVFFISGLSKDDLIDIAILICKKLDKSYFYRESDKEYLLSGQEIRPSGCFSVRYNEYKNQLFVDNRNGRGDTKLTQKLKDAVDSVILEHK